MNASTIIAITKAITKKIQTEARALLAPGSYDVDFVAHIVGTLNVGEDYEQKIVAKADPWKLLAVALSKLNNITLESIIREAEAGTLTGDDVKVAAEAKIADLKSYTIQSCKGKVTAKLEVEVEEEVTVS